MILGHSLGGLVATAALGAGRIASPRALLLAATCVWLHGPRGPLLRRAIMRAFPFVTKEPTTYVRQLTGWAKAGRWTSLRGVDYRAGLANLEAPTFPFSGVGDWMCTPSDAEGFAGLIPSATRVKMFGKRHGDPSDPDHFGLFRADLPRLREWIVDVATR